MWVYVLRGWESKPDECNQRLCMAMQRKHKQHQSATPRSPRFVVCFLPSFLFIFLLRCVRIYFFFFYVLAQAIFSSVLLFTRTIRTAYGVHCTVCASNALRCYGCARTHCTRTINMLEYVCVSMVTLIAGILIRLCSVHIYDIYIYIYIPWTLNNKNRLLLLYFLHRRLFVGNAAHRVPGKDSSNATM